MGARKGWVTGMAKGKLKGREKDKGKGWNVREMGPMWPPSFSS